MKPNQFATPRVTALEGVRASLSFSSTIQIGGTNATFSPTLDLVHHVNGTHLHMRVIADVTEADQLANLQADNEQLSKRVAAGKDSRPLSNDQFSELMSLRGEVGRLMKAVQELSQPKRTPRCRELIFWPPWKKCIRSGRASSSNCWKQIPRKRFRNFNS